MSPKGQEYGSGILYFRVNWICTVYENGYHPHFVFCINICRVSVANLNVSADKYILYFASFFLEYWRKHTSWSQLMCSPWVSRANSFKLRMIFMSFPNWFCDLFITSSEVHQTIPAPHHAQGCFLCQPAQEGSWPWGTAWLLEVSNNVLEWIVPGSRKDLGTSSSLQGYCPFCFSLTFSSFSWGSSCLERGQCVCGGSGSSGCRAVQAQLWECRQLLQQPHYWKVSLTNLLSDDLLSL